VGNLQLTKQGGEGEAQYLEQYQQQMTVNLSTPDATRNRLLFGTGAICLQLAEEPWSQLVLPKLSSSLQAVADC
jgi:hypothetical protein